MGSEQTTALAAWVQAIASVLAIFISAGIAIWISHRDRRRHTYEMSGIVSVLADASAIMTDNLARRFSDRVAIHRIADGQEHYDADALHELHKQIASIPLYEIGNAKIALEIMLIRDNIRQFRLNIDNALKEHRQMDAAAFTALFSAISEAADAIKVCAKNIRDERANLR